MTEIDRDYIRLLADRTEIDKLWDKLDQILNLINSLGTHPAFTLPPVSEFVKQLKEIVGSDGFNPNDRS